MLLQAQNAKDALIQAGLNRKDFSVRTERIMKHGRFIGYGGAQVNIWNLPKAIEVTPELLKYFEVEHRIMDTITLVYVYDNPHARGKFTVRDYREVQS